jgi:predicted amidophosphoribosyltransferase
MDLYPILKESVQKSDLTPCAVCGETLVRFAKTCRRCLRNMDEDRERREVEGYE